MGEEPFPERRKNFMSDFKPEQVEETEFPPSRVNNPVVRFLGGLKFGLTVLTVLAVATTVGEFLPYENDYSLKLVFTTWWYRALLATTALNLILNTYITYVEETSQQFLPKLRKKADHFKTLKIAHRQNFKETGIADSKSMMASISEAFARRGYRTFYDGNAVYGHRGLIARFGSTVTHLGLITIIAGALVESFKKIEGMMVLAEGETGKSFVVGELTDPENSDEMPLGFSVRLDDFDHIVYPGTGTNNDVKRVGTAKRFKSTVTFFPKDGDPVHNYVRVNHDVTYGGWTFHQSSWSPAGEGQGPPRYFVNLEERLPDGGRTLHQFETYVLPRSWEITPIPGYGDRFFAAKSDPGGRNVVWAVTSKDAILARGATPRMGDFTIMLEQFYPDMVVSNGQIGTRSMEPNNPAALISISSGNKVVWRDWVFNTAQTAVHRGHDGAPTADASGIEFVITNVEPLADKVAAAPSGRAAAIMGKPDPEAVTAEGGTGREISGPVAVTIEMQHQGQASGRSYRLEKGTQIPLVDDEVEKWKIEGDFELAGLHPTTTFISFLSVSKNPGIPIVWLGAILASLGPFLAFFVSRRRVWVTVDWDKKALQVGGESRYTREGLEDEIAEVMKEWSGAEGVALKPAFDYPVPEKRPRLSQHL